MKQLKDNKTQNKHFKSIFAGAVELDRQGRQLPTQLCTTCLRFQVATTSDYCYGLGKYCIMVALSRIT